MSERKVLSKYYPPDFDPSKITQQRKPKDAAYKVQTVRLMAPFSMKCNACGEYIYKGRKFNARKETADESYYAIKIFRFYIRCTRCSAEILFKTDPRNMDYTCEKGATRNFEPWHEAKLAEETDEERLEREEAERDAMAELEVKTSDAKTEIAVTDALDEIRMRNARLDRAQQLAGHHPAGGNVGLDGEVARQDREDEEASRQAFRTDMDEGVKRVPADDNENDNSIPAGGENASSYSFARSKKKKKDYGSTLGIKRKWFFFLFSDSMAFIGFLRGRQV